ncbi:hypothetical protein GCM10010832_12920 [Psychroflexus planctonicus]|uniref:histidine kinase n=1 Tax=Psychroflexus planctonicus TaxID=1526575 RepID=A0ABQ1SEL9_9FLAO|nr:hypothetical protein GCM10010832_12920 [Psychroflexus planctonicus]
MNHAQQKTIDSLLIELESFNKGNIERVDLLNELAYHYSKSKPDSVFYFSNEARMLSEKIEYPKGIADALKNEAIYFYYQSEVNKSFENLDKAISIYKDNDDIKGLSSAYNNYGLIYNSYGNHQEAFKKYEKALAYNLILKDTFSLTRGYVNQANSLSNQSKFDEAKDLYEKGMTLAKKTEDLEQQANIYNGYAIIAERTGEFKEAKASILKAQGIYEKLDLPGNLFITHNNTANINRKQANYVEAIQNFQEALKYANQIGNKRYQGIVYNNIASCWYDLGDNQKALEMYQESVAIAEKIDQRTYMAGISNIALIYSEDKDNLEKLDEALALYKKVETHLLEQETYGELSNTYNNIAKVYLQKEDTITAKANFEKAIKFAEEKSNKYNLTSSYSSLAELSLIKKKYNQAIELGEKSIQIAEELELLKEVINTAEILVSAYEAKENYKKALQYQKRIDQISKDLFNEEKSKEIGRLEAEMEFKAKEQKIRLENEKELLQKEVSLRRQEKINMAFAVGMIAFLIIIILLFKNKRDKEKANKKLQNSQEKIENQNEELKELHHQKNKLFSIISHDLRGPLQSLNSFFEMALQNEISDAELKSMVPEINKNLQRTIILTDNLLNWSSKLVKRQQSKKSSVSILKVTNNVEDLFQTSIDKKYIKLTKIIDEDLKVSAVEDSLDLVIRNLLSNAIKFSDEKGEIEISATQISDNVQVCIKDTGIGMTDNQAKKVFHGELNSVIGTNNEKGSGIGLLLCKDFIEENDGKIWVEKTAPNQGTSICFTLAKAE